MNHFEMLCLVMLIDAALGEPNWLWGRIGHPAMWMGRAIDWCESRTNKGGGRRVKGAGVMFLLVITALLVGGLVKLLPDYGVLEVLGGAALLAHRSLIDHVRDVRRALGESIEAGRLAVARIVGRDVSTLDESGVARAAIESGAENFSDGVIAPAFWFLLLGLPGILAYKIINTADSMIGHRSERYAQFGWAAARLDDLVNWVPARLTGLLICASGNPKEAFDVMRHDADLHASPNAGWPEAAMAGSLNIALGGPRSYAGEMVQLAWMNSFGRRVLDRADIGAAVMRLWRAWAIVLAAIFVLSLLLMLIL